MKRVLVGMSGGVDSSVAVILLQKQGYEVVGVTFQFIDNFNPEDAIEVAKKLNIEHHVLDYRKEFKKEVIDTFINDYKNGLTPNPCVICNKYCKFKFMFDNMEKYNCDYIATGHYAIIKDNKLYKSKNKEKDQSYFLCEIPKEKLSNIIFPLEGLEKDKVREIARENNLLISNKKDSFDVCFITDTFRDYMKNNTKEETGKVINIKTNEVIGEHIGLSNYTIGQRKGLNIGGTEDKMYVVGKDLDKNILYIALGDNNEYLISTSCIINKVNFLVDNIPNTCKAKFRYRQQELPVEIELLDNNEVLVKYNEGVKSVTPGQACVFYQDDLCLGGGIIKEVQRNNEKLWYL